jgi:hypothetical protein
LTVRSRAEAVSAAASACGAATSSRAAPIARVQVHQQEQRQRQRRVRRVEHGIARRWERREPQQDVEEEPAASRDPHADAERQRDTEAADGEHPAQVVEFGGQVLRDERPWSRAPVSIADPPSVWDTLASAAGNVNLVEVQGHATFVGRDFREDAWP